MERRSRHLGSASDSERRVDRMITRHGPALLRVARHFSLCQDDALDAYQRGLEIYLRRLESLDPATELGWLKVVIRHEAMAVRRDRQADVGAEDPDLDARPAGEQRSVDDRIASSERSSRSAEALRHLKADEAKALMLKAQGHSYREIGEQLGWTYTKTNRAITEGRARFMKVFGRIEAGEECERFAPVLIAMVAGRAGADALIEIRPHLRHCARCRATIRKLHLSRRDRAAALIPLPVLVPLRWIGAKLGIGGSAESTLDAPTQHDDGTGDATTLDGADSLSPPQAEESAAPDGLDSLDTPELPHTGDPTTPAHQPDIEELAHRFDDMTTPSGVQHATAATEHASSAAEHAERVGRLHPLQLKQDVYGLFQLPGLGRRHGSPARRHGRRRPRNRDRRPDRLLLQQRGRGRVLRRHGSPPRPGRNHPPGRPPGRQGEGRATEAPHGDEARKPAGPGGGRSSRPDDPPDPEAPPPPPRACREVQRAPAAQNTDSPRAAGHVAPG